jgi:hypothetical protein
MVHRQISRAPYDPPLWFTLKRKSFVDGERALLDWDKDAVLLVTFETESDDFLYNAWWHL